MYFTNLNERRSLYILNAGKFNNHVQKNNLIKGYMPVGAYHYKAQYLFSY
jgi:hypothetical protein